MLLFQFTPLREGRLADESADELCRISIHAPPRGATLGAGAGAIVGIFQFTPLREGRLDGIRHLVQLILISIHAPPRGATSYRRHYRGVDEFQFTPLREGRLQRGFSLPHAYRFQFTPLREGRRGTQ